MAMEEEKKSVTGEDIWQRTIALYVTMGVVIFLFFAGHYLQEDSLDVISSLIELSIVYIAGVSASKVAKHIRKPLPTEEELRQRYNDR